MKLYYIANARMPSERAHGIQIAKMCEAFLDCGIDLVLLLPSRGRARSLKDFYGLSREIPARRLPALPAYGWGTLGYRLATASFVLSALVYLFAKKLSGERALCYEIDMDQLSIAIGPLAPFPFFIEIHDAKPRSSWFRFIFHHASFIIAINSIIKQKIAERFGVSKERILAFPNGIDIPFIQSGGEKLSARRKISLPEGARIALSTGQMYDWKGLEILPAVARRLPAVTFVLVGGGRDEFVSLSGIRDLPPNLLFVDRRPYPEIPYWLAAADLCFVVGTKKNEYSYFHTSPMKLFEYLASGRTIVAAKTPAIADMVSDREVFFYEPDSAESFAATVTEALSNRSLAGEKSAAASEKAGEYTWRNRAEAVLAKLPLP